MTTTAARRLAALPIALLLVSLPALPLAAQTPPAPAPTAALPPGTHRVVDDLVLSLGVAIDDPDRLIVWQDSKPVVVERRTDSAPWAGDVRTWTEGEFVENDFPVGYDYRPGHLTPGVNVRCSKHVRIIYGNHPEVTEEFIVGNLRLFEECLKLYHLKLGFPVPFESRDVQKRDGRKHKVDVIVGASNLPPIRGEAVFTGGGCYGCWDGDRAMGYAYAGFGAMRHTPPSGATPHEMGHACQMHAYVHSPGSGFWWEAHANWLMLQYLNDYPTITNIHPQSQFHAAHGRNYYDTWQIFETLAETPGYGLSFVTRLWAEGEDMLYLWNKAERLASPHAIADLFGETARRNVTWDYRRGHWFSRQDTDETRDRYGRVLLEPTLQPGEYRVPWAIAPQQFGFNTCPLRATGPEVAADFRGLVDPARGSGWRVSLVAVAADGRPRYSPMVPSGEVRLAVQPDDRGLFLVVCATPTVMEILVDGDYRGPAKATFPYAVRLQGAEPLDLLADGSPAEVREATGPGKPHANGGGFVADSAQVDPTAWVGPRARVLGRAKVLGSARIEDHAVVAGEAVVQDRAVLRGHALVKDHAVVRNDAHVADWGRVWQHATVADEARVLEFATAADRVRVGGRATLKGRAFTWGKTIGGTAILDGDYANGLQHDRNVWFHWFVNDQAKADAAADLQGLYAQYLFAQPHPWLALDTHGATHGLLVGGPAIGHGAGDAEPKDFLVLDGANQYVELRRDVAFVPECHATLQARWDGGSGEQRLLEFCSPDRRNRIALTVGGPDEQLALAVCRDGKETRVPGGRMPRGTWCQVAIALADGGTQLLRDGKVVARDDRLRVRPWDLGLSQCFLGRGLDGGFLRGAIAQVSLRCPAPAAAR